MSSGEILHRCTRAQSMLVADRLRLVREYQRAIHAMLLEMVSAILEEAGVDADPRDCAIRADEDGYVIERSEAANGGTD